MSNHTINSWKKYCLHYKEAIEDLRDRANSNAEKRATPEDTVATNKTEDTATTNETEDTATTNETEDTVTTDETEDTVMTGETRTEVPGTALSITPETAVAKSELASPEMVPVKMEPLDEVQLDLAFAADVLSSWNPNEESDEALWNRMEATVR
jgi:archaellum component FlaD/FlaE